MYRVLSSAFAAAAAFIPFSWCQGALGQGVDPNFQTRLESIEPPPKPVVVPSKVREEPVFKVTPAKKVEVKVTRLRTPEEMRSLLAKQGKARESADMPDAKLFAFAEESGIARMVTETRIRDIPERKVQVGVKTVAEPRQVTASLVAPVRYDYVSNVFTTRANHRSDFALIAVPKLTVGIPVGPAEDTISLIAQTSMVRYDEFENRDSDSIFAQVGYTTVLSNGLLSWSGIASKTKSKEALSFTYTSTLGFSRGFEGNPVVFSTPAVAWGIERIPVGPWLCGQDHCLKAGIGVEIGHSWSDVPTLDNSALTGSASLSWILPQKWAWTGSVSVSGKDFENFPDGRQDVVIQARTGLTWSPTAMMSLVTGLEYTRQFSSQQALNWDGFRVQPQVRLIIKLQ